MQAAPFFLRATFRESTVFLPAFTTTWTLPPQATVAAAGATSLPEAVIT